jgi:stage II sporulation protein D
MGPGPYGIPPLHGHIACEFCSGSPFYRWQKRLTYADVAWAVKQQGRGSIWPVDGVEIAEQSPTGRVARVRIRGARQLLLSGSEFRQLFGTSSLRSTAFTLVPDGDGVILQGRGWGHGVGLCQWGAAELARLGLKAHEILAVYYPGTELATVGQAIRTPGIPRLPTAASEEGN